MFSGIVAGMAEVIDVVHQSGLANLVLKLPTDSIAEISQGASIAVDGVCLTVTELLPPYVKFDLMGETLNKTTLKSLDVGDKVNIERALKIGDEIGGHEISGHVDSTAKIIKIEKPENNHVVTFSAPQSLMRYILPKGYISLDGCSLTIVDVADTTFSVWLIPETLNRTTFCMKSENSLVNLEVDAKTKAIVDTTERMLGVEV